MRKVYFRFKGKLAYFTLDTEDHELARWQGLLALPHHDVEPDGAVLVIVK